MDAYLKSSDWIDWETPAVLAQAQQLATGDVLETARRCYEFVRDEIRHSCDFHLNPVTCRASDVLKHRTGYCYAKSHLLAALLRANGIPAALCYQRLSIDGDGAPFSLHGLNAVHLPGHGWYRVDARGNKPGVDAAFSPPRERLAFALLCDGERDLQGLYAEPLPQITDVLTRFNTWEEVLQNLPDVESEFAGSNA